MADIKFKLTNETKVNWLGKTLFRIEATVAIPARGVKKGDKGGWVESEKLDNGNARVYGNAWVYGDAEVSGDARVYGNAEVSGNAKLSLRRAFTQGQFVYSSDDNIQLKVIDQFNEEGFDSGQDYKNLLVIGDYEIEPIDPTPAPEESIEIEGKKYTLTEIKEALTK